MLVSFAAVVLITVSQSMNNDSDEKGEDKEEKERLILADNDTLAGLVGCLCILALALINGIVSVQTRMMQTVSVVVTMFYIGVFSSVLTAVWLLIEFAVQDGDS